MASSSTVAMFVFCGLVGATAVVSVNELIDLDPFRPKPPASATASDEVDGRSGEEARVAEPATPTVEPAPPEQVDVPAEPDDAMPAPALPEPDVAETDSAPDVAVLSDGEPVSDAATPDEAGPAAAAPDLPVPRFDVLRAEPDGSLVIAGGGPSDAAVEIVAGTQTIARVQAGPTGDFAAVLDDPLAPGDYQIVLRATTPDGIVATSRETAVVSIPETGSDDVLALVEEPGAPSRLITTPQPGAPALVPVAPEPISPPRSAAAPPVIDDTAPAVEPAPMDVARRPEEPDTAPPVIDEAEQTAADAAAEPEPPAPTAIQAAESEPLDLRIEAVEIDGIEVFVAGAATAGARILVYANEILLGDTIASEIGRFLVQARRDLPVGDYIIRADAIDPTTAQVLKRASVPFVRSAGERLAAVAAPDEAPAPVETTPDMPVTADEPPTLVEPAATTPVQPPADQSASAPEVPAEPRAETVRDRAPAPAPATLDVARREDAPARADPEPKPVETSPTAGEPAAIASETASASPPPGANEAAGVAADPSPDDPPMQSPAPAATGDPAPPADDAPGTTIETRAAPMVPVDGSVIIRRGDTLWQISRRVYGRGVKYTTIYLANQDQITDPGRIWPGQIFDVPNEADEDAEAVHRELRNRRR